MPEYKVTEYKDENCIVRIHKPILTAEEKERRLQEVRKALAEYGREKKKDTKEESK